MTVSPIRSFSSSLRRVAAAALLCGLSACALIHHDTQPAAALDPERIRIADDIHLAHGDWPSARWWTRYADPQLDALIERALGDAPTMAIARTRVAQARANVDLVKAGTNLQVSALGSVDRERVSGNGFLGAYSGNEPMIGATGPWYTEGIVGLGASLDVDIWGKERAQVAAALGVRNARAVELSAVELELAADVAQLYYGIQTTYRIADLLEQLHAIATISVDAHAARAARGLEPRTPTETARAQQLTTQRQLAAARARITQLRESLRALVGARADELGDLRPVPLPSPPLALPTTLSYEFLARRPDLQALRWYVEASFDRIDAAKAAFYPSFDIKAFFGVNALHLADLFTHASRQINLVPGLTLPIFDGGRLNANLGGVRAASDLLILQYNQAVLNAVRDVAMTGSQLQDLDVEAKLQTEKIEAVRFAQDSVDAHYRTGLASRLAAVEAKQAVLVERMVLAEIDGRRIGQDIALTKALGGGYRAQAPVTPKAR
ncbi:MdtP family multidrug efflux transporter outer membrane subunit [Burkholderia stagnalis]|uniref:MdtP family multidrug efflux transporter outer membrane subunit n=1 Tax=Burkholderia stagnalis TaxID=1503054 RepID=UPI000F56EDE2|nr:MdtP family multidrug efflux transporter outer membrane subunit [Burkholderia stagnalis]RQQ45086.1 multidrug resistance transporter [Burkholderia stagnalis]RQX93964.1 multidrug resistance transporter [Burkholderia stagnalis]RQY20301.1 multidrug resistance transporter [Burkholderia stagnalis]RQY31510.1 multidrug resistance transporter [Burkholderia stagnalis]